MIKCACGYETDSKLKFVWHILTLGCYDECLRLRNENKMLLSVIEERKKMMEELIEKGR